jgi:hypothetical protein
MQGRRALLLEFGVRVGREWQEYLSVSGYVIRAAQRHFKTGPRGDSMMMNKLKRPGLAPRGCLVRVTSGSGPTSLRERWFAVGIYFQKTAESVVCALPEIDPSDVVFAYRRLKPTEISTLGLRRGQIVLCNGPLQDPETLGSAGSFRLTPSGDVSRR